MNQKIFHSETTKGAMATRVAVLSAIFSVAIFFGVASAAVPTAHAADLTVTPAVIDGTGVPDDILNYSVTVTNTSGQQQNVFASVYELTPSGTVPFVDPSGSDRPEYLADWIDVSRAAMTFMPGQSQTLPVSITINPYATAGDYHAVIAFVEGGIRADAETHLDGAPSAIVNMTVESNLTASLIIDGFAPTKGFYSSFPVTFNYTIENNGTVASTPSGELMFYDRLGHEIGSVDANPDSLSIAPGDKQSFSANWADGGSFGQYKAVLDVSYGPMDDKLENTALVWVLPWKELLIIFGSLFAAMIILALWLHRQYEKRHHRRRLALESLLNKRSAERNNAEEGGGEKNIPLPRISERSAPPIRSAGGVIDLRRHHD